jgi:O-antigen ligase
VVRFLVAGVLLAGPTALAFATGGFYDRPRTIAGIVAWALVALLAVVGEPLPRGRAAWAAIGGLAGLAGWSAVSLGWAPLAEPARDDVARLVAYTGALVASAMAWRSRRELRLVEPVLAAGALVVAVYGLAGSLGVIDLDTSATARGRLEQPLTYWNAMGILAAFGLTLAIRVAGDRGRPPALRAAAAAAAAPFGMTIYLTFSRGAIAALAVGIAILVVLSTNRDQIRAVAVAIATGVVAAVAASLGDGGALAALAALPAVAALLVLRGARAEPRSYALRRRAVAAGIVLAILAGAPLAAVTLDRGAAETSATATRFNDVGSNRYEYWEVALDTWWDQPLRGSGSGGFRVDWLRERDVDESVRDAHSLYLETAAELGTVGLLLLGLLLAGVAAGAAAAVRRERELAAGLVAALSVFAIHAALDWDWEMPAVALPAIVVAGALLRTAGGSPD